LASRAATVETLIGLLAATGMRVGEAIRLERPDLLWAEAVIVVRDSKFGKSRLVPLHASAVAALAAYAEQRDRLQPWPESPAFFVSTVGTTLLYCDVCHTFRKIIDDRGRRAPGIMISAILRRENLGRGRRHLRIALWLTTPTSARRCLPPRGHDHQGAGSPRQRPPLALPPPDALLAFLEPVLCRSTGPLTTGPATASLRPHAHRTA
jgi:hypothetical protein